MAVSSPGPLIAAPVRVPWWQLTGAHAQITCHRGTIPADFERFADGTKCMSCHDHAKVTPTPITRTASSATRTAPSATRADPPPVPSPTMYPIRLGFTRGGKCGYLDEHGAVAIEPTFDHAAPFEDGLAEVRVGTRWGYIAPDGTFAIEPRYASAQRFAGGFAQVQIEESERGYVVGVRAAVIDRHGVIVRDHTEGDGPMCEGLARVSAPHGFGYVRPDGTLAFSLDAVAARDFSSGRAAFARSSQRFGNMTVFGPYGFIDGTGAVVIEPRFQDVRPFTEGVAAVREGAAWVEKEAYAVLTGGAWGFIDPAGRYVIEPAFDFADQFSEGIARTYRDGAWQFLDHQGDAVLAPQVAHVESFAGGMARTLAGTLWGYLDRDGVARIPPQFTRAEDFRSGFALVHHGDTWGYIDRDGTWLWRSDSER